ncbi:F-box-like domain protein [Rhizoctonia solani 123E]|uniref:F-box-like domain protein n=1 Tax=Rhizoctonia solani 123E TaxID=1423351 RepID=A0A074RTI1_9AGAM|nr:F-box-like domain protein [Rhizoctonia solani 123E]
MIEQLRLAGDQLRTAWSHYCKTYSAIQACHSQGKSPLGKGFPPEFIRQFDTELAFISSYEPKIQEIKLSIKHARNYSSGLAPINSLPPEILSRIFHLVLAQPCQLNRISEDKKKYYPRYPDYLAHVCALWRRTAISAGSLWCHIDVSSYETSYDGLVARAETHLERTGEFPIELHIAMDGDIYDEDVLTCRALCSLLSDASDRVESLELLVPRQFGHFHRSLFGIFLVGQPPIFTKFIIDSKAYHWNKFIEPDYVDPGEPCITCGFELQLENSCLEACFAPLTVLHLRGVFPLWESKAYHGLVDLRLLSTSPQSTIKEVELINILKSSPGLRILHFGLSIRNQAADTEELSPVHLEDLQVVKIFPNLEAPYECTRSVLPLLAPGSKPLRLSFEDHYVVDASLITELERFFMRSRVTRFHTRAILPPVRILLRYAPHLEQVVLDYAILHLGNDLPSMWLGVEDLKSLPRLRSLHIASSTLFERELCLLLECCPRNTVLYSCQVKRDGSAEMLNAEELSCIFPSIRTADIPLHPPGAQTVDWDVLD